MSVCILDCNFKIEFVTAGGRDLSNEDCDWIRKTVITREIISSKH